MPTKIPDLLSPVSSGHGILNGKDTERLSSGSQVDRRVVDIEINHPITAESEAKVIETFMPGFWDAATASLGEKSTGGRTYAWDPKTGADWSGDCTVEILPYGGGNTIYKGPAQVRSFKGRGGKRNTIATVGIRLLSVDPNNDRMELSKNLGREVEYQIQQTVANTVTPALPVGQAPLPLGGSPAVVLHVDVGDIVTYVDDHGEGHGIAVMVTSDVVRLTGFLTEERGGTIEVDREDVTTVTAVCGPGGGPGKAAIERIQEAADDAEVEVRISHLLGALFEAVDDGLEGTDKGWPLTSRIRARTLELAEADADADAEGQVDDSDLPPEVDDGMEVGVDDGEE